MRNIIHSALLLAAAACLLPACDDDRDSNPTLLQPESIVLNTPAYAAEQIDLAHSETLNFTWSQPVFTTGNAPVAADYEVQVSPTGSFTKSQAEADADESGATAPDYFTAGEPVNGCTAAIRAEDVAKGLVQLLGWSEATVPATQNVYVRLKGDVNGHSECYSNLVQLTLVPYYIELKDAEPEMWYLIGQCIGDGSWSNTGMADVGKSIYPMALVKDYDYDSKTGQGELTFTGYLTTEGFKLIKTPGSWDDQWGQSGSDFVKNDGGSGNITVPADGYYTVTLNTQNNTLSVAAAAVTPTVYPQMLIAGDFNSWGTATAMTAVNTTASMAGHNHIWAYTLDASAGATTAKFLADSSWSPNWGAADFPYGYGVADGANIPVEQGTWKVIFNDIDGTYAFIQQ